jgi:hypothetical protein
LEEGAAGGVPAEVAEGEERPEALGDGLPRVEQPLAEEPLRLRGRLERGGSLRHLTPAVPYGAHAGEADTIGGGGAVLSGREKEREEEEEEEDDVFASSRR